MPDVIDFRTSPDAYRHWRVAVDGPIATLTMQVDPSAGLRDDYELKLNSYDLGVDIELYDAVQRLRFEHPEVHAVVVTSGLGIPSGQVFCSGANIQMLAGSTHAHKVNFCKFTNETRNSIEDATAHSGQVWIAAVNGTAAGGGYELALACDEIVLVDDRSSSVSLPEVPLLAVLPGTGGLTRVVDKRHVRRDLADVFATRAEGVKGRQAVEWKLVDSTAPRSAFAEHVAERAAARAAGSDRPAAARGIVLAALERSIDADTVSYPNVDVQIDRELGAANITVRAPTTPQPITPDELVLTGSRRVDPRRRPRARRRDAAPAVQRDRGRNVDASHRRRHRRRAGRRVAAVGRGRRLAGARGGVVLDPNVEASRPLGAYHHRPCRAG